MFGVSLKVKVGMYVCTSIKFGILRQPNIIHPFEIPDALFRHCLYDAVARNLKFRGVSLGLQAQGPLNQ